MNHKFNYKWNLSDGYPAPGIEMHNTKVFTTFSCGGGSSMGYKLAGYDVFAANDIDPWMKRVYEANHHPKYYFLSDIRSLTDKTDWPEEFTNLDILDGSPPCSTFSMVGSREEAWGKEKVFREGQAKQTLDDLFFEFVTLARKLQPKIVISENVKGMLAGHAKGYVKQIFEAFDEAGYTTQAFLLNGATMGVPQMRERIFFLSRRKDLNLPKINLSFTEKSIPLINALERLDEDAPEKLTEKQAYYWNKCKDGEGFDKYHPKKSLFGHKKVSRYRPCTTLTTKIDSKFHWKYKRYLTLKEWQVIGSFPLDYDFTSIDGKYLIGMSVPPIMMAQVSHQVYEQWLSKL